MAASARPTKSCNDNNDFNPNQNWKSTAFTTLSIACVLADEYLIPYFFPAEAMAAATMTAAYEYSSSVMNGVSAGFGAISGIFRRKKATGVDDKERVLLADDRDEKAVATTSGWKLVAQTTVPALAGALAAVAKDSATTLDRFRLGGKVAVGVNAALQAAELVKYGLYRCKDTPMIHDGPATVAPEDLGTPPTRKASDLSLRSVK